MRVLAIMCALGVVHVVYSITGGTIPYIRKFLIESPSEGRSDNCRLSMRVFIDGMRNSWRTLYVPGDKYTGAYYTLDFGNKDNTIRAFMLILTDAKGKTCRGWSLEKIRVGIDPYANHTNSVPACLTPGLTMLKGVRYLCQYLRPGNERDQQLAQALDGIATKYRLTMVRFTSLEDYRKW